MYNLTEDLRQCHPVVSDAAYMAKAAHEPLQL